MKKAKVIHMVEDLEVGGMESIVLAIACGIDRDKYDPEVWCVHKRGGFLEKLEAAGIKVVDMGINSCYNPKGIMKLSSSLKEARPDIVHTHSYFVNVAGRIAARMAGVPRVVTHIHNAYVHYSFLNCVIEKILSYFTDKIICCSEAVRNFAIKKEKINFSKLAVIYNGIDLQRFDHMPEKAVARRSLGINDDEILITSVASLTEKKGQKYLVEAAADIVKEHSNVKIMLVGKGPLKNKLEEDARRLNLSSSIVFLGVRHDIPEILGASDIFVLPSLVEGLSLAIIEAMAAGLAVVATNVGGNPEVVHDGITGTIIPPEDPEALSEAVKALLLDNRKLKTMGWDGRRVCREEFSQEIMIRKIEQLYDSLIKKI
ncbi:MAG: glycosyltransferase [Candidatus Omnitrophica bacterium]|nr:glycosyltransferase [Candidatus Omnitrophota bacterium]